MRDHDLYFTSLKGAFAGFISWAVGVWLPIIVHIPQEKYYLFDVGESIMIAFIMGFVFIFDRSLKLRLPRKIISLLLSLITGTIVGGLGWLIHTSGDFILTYPWLGKLFSWIILGVLIGAHIGIIKYGLNGRLILFSFIGGLLGSLAGGSVLFALSGLHSVLAHAFGLVAVGMGMAFGSRAGVIVMYRPKIKYVKSGIKEVANYFRKHKREWRFKKNSDITFGAKADSAPHFINIPDRCLHDEHVTLKSIFIEEREGDGNHKTATHVMVGKRDVNGFLMNVWVKKKSAGEYHRVGFHESIADGSFIKIGETEFLFLRGA